MLAEAYFELSKRAPLILHSNFQTYWKHEIGVKITFNQYTPCKECGQGNFPKTNYNESCLHPDLIWCIWHLHSIQQATFSCCSSFMTCILFLYPKSKPPTPGQISLNLECWTFGYLSSLKCVSIFFYLTVSGPRRSIALSVIYCVTVVPRHTPNSSHLVAMATGHRTLKDKITHIHTHAQTQEESSPVNHVISNSI